MKTHISISTMGSVYCGKSTTLGHIMVKKGWVDAKLWTRIESISQEFGKPERKFAWVFSELKAERERGITIVNQFRRIETETKIMTLIDIPGHIDFTKSASSGLAHADAAILVVSADPEQFEYGFNRNMTEHPRIALAFGISKIIVAINKMDSVGYKEDVYNELRDKTTERLVKIGYKMENVSVLPISALSGENLTARSELMPWYEGKTLFDFISEIPVPKPFPQSLRIIVRNCFKIGGIGTVPVGKVVYGELTTGQVIRIAPAKIETEVKSIETHNQYIESAKQGYQIGFNVKRVPSRDIHSGFVAGSANDNPPRQCERFQANIVVTNHPGQIKIGYSPVLHIHSAMVPCRIDKIISKLDQQTLKEIEPDPLFLKNGDCALVEIVPLKPVVVESVEEFPALGRFVLRDYRQCVIVGVVVTVWKLE